MRRLPLLRAKRDAGLLGLVVVTLALGIGGTTAVFGVVDGLLLRPLPYAEADRLLEVWTEEVPAGRRVPGLDPDVYRALRSGGGAFDAVEAYQFGAATLTGEGESRIVAAPRVTPGLLRLLGVAPRLGRLLAEADAASGSRAVLVSESLWKSRFGGGADVLGRTLRIDDAPHTVVGVLPAGFAFPERNAEVWRAVALHPDPGRLQTVVRLSPEVARESAAGPLELLSAHLREAGLLAPARRLVVEDPLQRRYGRRYATALYLMQGAVGLVLLVACVNVTLLLLARTTARRSELALRIALGARRSHLAGRVALESLALALLGAVGGVLLARFLLTTILDLMPPRMMMLATVAALDRRALAFALGLAAVTCVGIGALPALRAAGTDPISGLRGGGPGAVGAGGERGSHLLMIAQLALVFVLLASAGLLLRSFVRLVSVDPGFDTANLTVFGIQPSSERYRVPGASLRLLEQLDARLEADPAVGRATFADGAPPSSSFTLAERMEAEGRPDAVVEDLMLPFFQVAPDYFATLGIPLVEGRTFRADDPENAAVVGEGLSRRLWNGESALGRRLRLRPDAPWLTVMGVAGDVRAMGPEDPMGEGMELYLPFDRDATSSWFAIVIRTDGDHREAVAGRFRRSLRDLDDGVPIVEATSMEQRLLESVARPRFFLRLAAAFAAIAMLLAGVGVYGTAAYRVARRRHEMGVRRALGATGAEIVALVVGRGLRQAAWGCALGLAASVVGGRVLDSLLFETSPHEPRVLIAIAGALVGLVAVASYLPAREAGRVDPAAVLRTD